MTQQTFIVDYGLQVETPASTIIIAEVTPSAGPGLSSTSSVDLVANSLGTLVSWTFGTDGNLNTPGSIITSSGQGGNISGANVVTANTFVGDGSNITGVAHSTTGSWTVTTGTNSYSFTVPGGETYTMWVNGNIPNGIVVWNATLTLTNTNVPVIGQQFAWFYEAGNALVINSIPSQIIGTAGAISNSAPVLTNSNVFTFSITNNSGNSQTVNYGWTKIS